jgi:hypothetical protein
MRDNCQPLQEDFEDHNVKSPTFYNLEVKEFPNHFNTNSRLMDKSMNSSVQQHLSDNGQEIVNIFT